MRQTEAVNDAAHDSEVGAPAVHTPVSPQTSPFRQSLFQVCLVFLGALLALGFDQWRDERAEASQLTLAVNMVRAELSRAETALRDAQTRHISRSSAFEAALQALKAQEKWEPPNVEGGSFGAGSDLSDAAFSALRVSAGVSELHPEKLLALGRFYTMVDRYRELDMQYLAAALNTDYSDERSYLKLQSFWSQDLAAVEGQLIELAVAARLALDTQSALSSPTAR